MTILQVLLVTGGLHWPGGRYTRLDSTELLVMGAAKWRIITTGKLPSPRYGLRAATLLNTVYLLGKN